MYASVSVVTPAYNDSQTTSLVLTELVALLKQRGGRFEVVIIDDESRDETAAVLRQFALNKPYIRLFFHQKNQGIARVYRELYRRARYPIIVLFSLDGEWDPKDALRLVDKLERENLDITIGWRKIKAYRCGRKIVSTLYNYFVTIVFHVPSYDAGSIKAMRKRVAEIPIISRGVFDEAERIVRAHRMGYRIGVLPVRHQSLKKRRFLPRLTLIAEALIDFVRVWWSLK